MKFAFEVGRAEPHTVEFFWGQMFGTLQIKIDGKIVNEKSFSLFSPSSITAPLDVPDDEKLNFGFIEVLLVEKWSFEVGIYEKHFVRIEKRRARFLAGLRPHVYRVFVDEELLDEHCGY